MRIKKIRASRAKWSVLALALAGLFTSQNVTGDRMLRLSGHMPGKGLLKARQLGRMIGGEKMQLALMLQLHDQPGLDDFLKRVHDPQDPLFQHFLTPQEFAERFGPREKDVDVVLSHLARHDIAVKKLHPNRFVIEIEGEAADIERAFQVELNQYRKADGLVAHAPSEDPSMPAEVASRVQLVAGLSNLNPRQHHLRSRGVQLANPGSTSSFASEGLLQGRGLLEPRAVIDDFMTPAKIKTAYNLDSVAATGAGQTLALFQLDGYTASDITTYVNHFGLPAPNLENILVGGFNGVPGAGAIEVTMDIELVVAMAPGLTKILVYEGPNTEAGVLATYSQIANDNRAAQVSTSWGLSEDLSNTAFLNGENTIFQQMAAQGQSMFAAAGDSGAFDDFTRPTTLSVDDPAAQPFVTAVGGTALFITTANTYASETSWGEGAEGEGGGGGVSRKWPIPSYQSLVGTNNQGHSATQRMVPDVALNSHPGTGYPIFFSGAWRAVGGTSAAAPLWAAFVSLVNEQRAANARGRLGFANPPLYQVGQSAQYPAAFHDLADNSTNLYFPAVPNYDLSTGWGSFNGATLFSHLTAASLPAQLAAPSVPAGFQVLRIQ